MSKDRTVLSTEVSQEGKGSRASWQRSSILKPPKHREPLQDLHFKSKCEEDVSSSSHSYTKRVSFHKAIQTKEFHVEEAATIWGLTYEETFKSSSDSSHQTDNSSCPSASKVTGFDHQLCSNINTPFPLKSHTIRDDLGEREGMDHCRNNFRFHAINSDDEQCFPQNEMHICNQSNDMDFTEPLDVNMNLNQTGLLPNNKTELTKPLTHYIVLDQKWNSGLSTVFDQELKTTGEIDTKLKGTLLNVHSGFQDHTKSHNKSKEGFRSFVDKTVGTAEPDCSMKVSNRGEVKESEERSTYLSVRQAKSKEPNVICDRELFFNKFPTAHSKEIPHIDEECCSYFLSTGIPAQVNDSDLSFTEVVSCNQNKYELDNNGQTFQSSPHCATNVEEYENSALKQSMELTKSFGEIKSFNNIEMFKSSVPRDTENDRIQKTGNTAVHASEFGTSNFQGFNKINKFNKSRMTSVSSLSTDNHIQGSGNVRGMISNSMCLHTASEGNVQNMGSAKPAGNVTNPSITDETCMNKMVDSSEKCMDTSDMELTCEMKQKQTYNAEVFSQITGTGDMELTCSIKHKGIGIPFKKSADTHAEITNRIRQTQISNSILISSTAADEMELTCERTQNQTSNLPEVTKHTGNVTDMELTKEIEWKETCNPGNVNRYVYDMEQISDSRQKQTSKLMEVSSHIGSASDMELTNAIKWKQTCNPGDVNKYVNNMELMSQSRQKQTSKPMEVYSQIDNANDMELTSGITWTGMCNSGDVNKYVNDMELASRSRQKQTSRPVEVSSHIDTATDMELTSGMTWTRTCNSGDVNKYVNDMELASRSRQKQTSRPVEVSSHIDNATDMELTSGIRWRETWNPGDVNKYVNDMEQTSQSRQKQTYKPMEVYSHIDNATDMELTSGIKWTETCNSGDVNKYVNDMELASQSRQKQTSRPIEVSSHINNATDMELTSGIKWTETCNSGDVNKYVKDMELTSESRQKGTSKPVGVSSCIGNTTDMELTSGIKQTETCNPGDVHKYVNDMELTSESRQKQTSKPMGVSSCIGNTTDMELTSGIMWIETCNPGDVNKYVNDMELASGSRQKETSKPMGVSSHIGNTNDMELTSVIKQIKTCNPGDVNKHVNAMELTCESIQKQTSRPMEVYSHTDTATDMELTNGTKWTETCNLGDVNKYVNDMELANESRQKETSRSMEVYSHIGNTTDMELTSGIKQIQTYNPGDVNKYVNAMELTSEKGQNQMSAESTTSVGDLELRNEVSYRTVFNPSRVTNLSARDVTDMKLSNINEKGQLGMINECASSSDTVNTHIVHHKQSDIHTQTYSETNNISGTETWKEALRVSFSQTSNMDSIKLSKEEQMEDVADVSYHSLMSCNMKTISNVKELHSTDSEVTQCSQPTARINLSTDTSTDKMSPSDCAEAETSPRQISPSKLSTVHALGSNEKLKMNDNSVESANCNSMELNVVNNTSSNTSGTAVGFNLSIPSNMKKSEKGSSECDMKLSRVSKLNQELVNGSIQNIADELSLSQGRHGLENSKSSDKVAKVSQTCRGDNQVMEENSNMRQPLTETNTYTCCTTGVKKFVRAVELDNVGNTVSHGNKQFQNEKEGVREKTLSQEYSAESTQIFRSHKGDSFLLEELGCKHEHTIKQPTLNKYTESSDLHARIPSELHDDQTVKEVNTATPKNSTESTEMEQNLHYSLLQSTLTSIPDEMELSIIKDLSFETNESYKELVHSVRKADEIIREKMCMTSNESAVLGNRQSAQSNSEERALLPQEMNNSENSVNEPITMEQESAKHLEAETVTKGQNSNPNGMFVKSCIKQTDEQIKLMELRKDTNDVVAMSSVEEQIKAKELRSDRLWNIKEMSDALWSFQFLYKSMMLILKLNPCDMQDSSKVVTDIQLISHATEKADPLVKLVHHVLLQKFQIQALDSICKTTLDVAELLETISVEVKKMEIFVKDVIELEIFDMIHIQNNCVSFDIADLDIHAWFRITVNIDTWENISPADVSVENVVGNVRGDEIKHLVTAATRGPNCLKDYIRIIKEYVKVLGKNNYV